MPVTVTIVLFSACWLASVLVAAAQLARQRDVDWRFTILLGFVIGGAAVVGITDLLSVFSRLQRGWIIAAWLVALAVSGGLLRSRARSGADVRSRMRRLLTIAPSHLSVIETVMVALIALQILLLAAVALVYPPNNYDSMAYHLARIMHWEQQRSVAFYPSAVMMQTRGAPFAEYAIAHSLLVAGSDRFANLVQWYAMVVSSIGASVVAAELGADRLRQIAAALLCASIPMGILQATSTQNDYVTAAWMVAFVAFAARFVRAPASPLWTLAMAAALGLAIATKQTALAYAPPFCIAIGCAALPALRVRAVAAASVIGAIVLALNGGFLLRTTLVVGSPVGSAEALANEERSPAVALSNAIRGLALNLRMSDEIPGLRDVSAAVLTGLERLNARTGIDPASPAASLTPANSAFAEPFRLHEDLTGNFLHALLAIAAVGVCAAAGLVRAARRRAGHPAARAEVLVVVACLIAGYLFFGYYFKWQVWHTRLQLPLFVVAAPVVAVVLFARSRTLIAATAIVAGVAGFFWTFGNETRPLNLSMPLRQADRMRWYFANRPELVEVMPEMAAAIAHSGCTRIGLRIGRDPFEYPLWVGLRAAGVRPAMRHLEFHYLVLSPPFAPCAVVSAGAADASRGVKPRQFGPFYLHLLPATTGF